MIDKRNKFDEEFFTYKVAKDGQVLIYWYNKHIKTLSGEAAQRFLIKIDGLEGKSAQLALARATN